MENLKNWGFISGLTILALLFSVAAVFTPWWRVTTTKETEITNEISIKAEYGLFQTVSASKISKVENKTLLRTLSFSDLPGSNADKNALSLLFSNVYILTLVGSLLTTLTAVLTFISGFRKFPWFNYIKFIEVFGAILLLAASTYVAVELHPIVSRFDSVIPTEIYVLPGNEIYGFWGGTQILSGLKEWTWGPAVGWLLAFTASLLSIGTFVLFYKVYEEK